jgi:hypothetical protein
MYPHQNSTGLWVLEELSASIFRVQVSMASYTQGRWDRCLGSTKDHKEVVAHLNLGNRRGGKSCLRQQE